MTMTESTTTGRYQIIENDGENGDMVIAIINDERTAVDMVADHRAALPLGSSTSYRYTAEQTSKAPYEI